MATDLKHIRADLSAERTTSQQLRNEIAALNDRTAELAKFEQEAKELRQVRDDQIREIDILKGRYSDALKGQEEKSAALSTAEAELVSLRPQVKKATSKVEKLEAQLEHSVDKERLAEREAEVKNLREKLKEATRALDEERDRQSSLEQEKVEQKAELDLLKAQTDVAFWVLGWEICVGSFVVLGACG
jgi:chromosome segregation ATPase